MSELPGHVVENRRMWDAAAPGWVESGERLWSLASPEWGIWCLPDSEVGLLPDDMRGLHAIELGCGTGYVSGWMILRGATCVGIDNSQGQLATARRLADEHGADLQLLHGNAETLDFPDGTFDFAVSEYGASLWCDPHVWIAEAHRVLRPGGRLHFLTQSSLAAVCAPADGTTVTDRLARSYLDLHILDWRGVDEIGGVEFNLPPSGWFRLFADVGFRVDGFLELGAPAHAEGEKFYTTAEWSRLHPCEQVWKLTKVP